MKHVTRLALVLLVVQGSMALAVDHSFIEPRVPEGEGSSASEIVERVDSECSVKPHDPSKRNVDRAWFDYEEIVMKTEVTSLRAKEADYKLQIETLDTECVPGTTGARVSLLSQDGRILDWLVVSIPERLDSGDVRVALSQHPRKDGAQVVFQYVGHYSKFGDGTVIPKWFHSQHCIDFRGRSYGFATDEGILRSRTPVRPDAWAELGLCRVKISQGKFVVVFPDLERPDEDLVTCHSIRVRYHPESNPYETRQVLIDDAYDVKSLLAALSVHETTKCAIDISNSNSSTVDFNLAGGKVRTIAFGRASVALLNGWGCFDLKSRKFYDRLFALLSKREGKPVKFADVQAGL